MAGCFSEKLRQCLSEYISQRSKVSSALNSPEYWILRYIRSDLFNIGRRCMQCYHHPVISFAKIEYVWYLFFPLGLSCTDGENNCVTCNADADMCETCDLGFTADVNGVCQGKLLEFYYRIRQLLILQFSFIFHLLDSVLLGRSMSTKYVFSEICMLSKRVNDYVKTILLVLI